MTSEANQEACWPTEQQELLLNAALLSGEESVRAWKAWRARVDVPSIDYGSYRLLPLAYRNLLRQGVSDPLMDKLKGVYRHTWSQTQILLRQMEGLLRAFHERGIETIVLKGAALVVLYYEDYGVRPMEDFDVLIRPDQLRDALQVVQDLGWREQSPVRQQMPVVPEGVFVDRAGRLLDLHWHMPLECLRPGDDDDFWDGARQARIIDEPTRVLNPTDQLLHVCVHGARWNVVPPFRWIADAMMILNHSGMDLDWSRLVAQAQKRHFVLPVRLTLAYLQEKLSAPVPTSVLRTLNALPVSAHDRAEYRAKTSPRRFWGYLFISWYDYVRLAGSRSPVRALYGFPKYLQHFWGLEHFWQVPLYAMRTTLRRVRTSQGTIRKQEI